MKRTWTSILPMAAVAIGFGMASAQAADLDLKDPAVAKYVVGDKYSGYVISKPATRAMNDDDFANPGFLWVDIGETEWNKVEGEAGKSCASCHNDVSSMKGVGASYPKYSEKDKKIRALEDQIGECRTERMKAENWKWESDQMLGMTALIKMQSRGMPVNVSIDGPAKPFFEKGKEFFYERRGQMDMACSHCHEDNAGNYIRSDLLSMAMGNGFPTYRLKWQKLGSLHRRFSGCNKNIRAKNFKRGSDEYTNLELFVMWRSNGLPVESPSVRR